MLALFNTFQRNQFPPTKMLSIPLVLAFCFAGTCSMKLERSYCINGSNSGWETDNSIARHKDMAPKYEKHFGRRIKNFAKFVFVSYTGWIFMACMVLGFLALFGDFATWLGDADYGNGLAGDQGSSFWARIAVMIPCFGFALGSVVFAGFRFYHLQHETIEYKKVEYKAWKHGNEAFGTTTDLKNCLHLFSYAMIVLSIAIMIMGAQGNSGDVLFWSASIGLCFLSCSAVFFLFRSSPNMNFFGWGCIPFKNKKGPLVKKQHLKQPSSQSRIMMCDNVSHESCDTLHSNRFRESPETKPSGPMRQKHVSSGSQHSHDSSVCSETRGVRASDELSRVRDFDDIVPDIDEVEEFVPSSPQPGTSSMDMTLQKEDLPKWRSSNDNTVLTLTGVTTAAKKHRHSPFGVRRRLVSLERVLDCTFEL